jgi:hypothetical protein
MSQITLPAKTKEIVVGANTYTINRPTNRQFMAIYARRSQLAKEQYDALSYSIDGNARYVALLIDAVSTFENIMPEQFFKDVNIKNILDGDILEGAELVKVYQEQVVEWLNELTKAIAEVLKSTEKKDGK